MTTIDRADDMSFWTVGEYYATNSSFNWRTRVGKFNFKGGGQSPRQTATDGCTKVYSNTKASPDPTAASLDSAGLSGTVR